MSALPFSERLMFLVDVDRSSLVDGYFLKWDEASGKFVFAEVTEPAGMLLADGSVPLTANWDVGAFTITAARLISDVADGTAPFSATSTTLCPNLNADRVDGIEGTALVKRDGSTELTANWDVGAFTITGTRFISDIATGTAPFGCSSTTVVTNLNADTVDGKHSTALILVDGTQAFSGDQSMGGNKLTNVATPVADTDAANKAYADAISAGMSPKESVRVATAIARTLASHFEDGDVIDGVTLVTGDRVLVKDQVDATENGIYVVAASGAPSRASDLAAAASANGAFCLVLEGDTNALKQFACVSPSGSDVVGTDDLDWTQTAGGGGVTDHGDLAGLTDAADHPQYLTLDGSRELTANWDVGAFTITGTRFISDIATGTAPFGCSSTTVVTNLNADQVDGKHSTALVLVDGTQAFSGDQSLGGNKLTNVATPTSANDAANKAYVDAAINGLDWKASVRVATIANGTLATAFANGQTVDGVNLNTGDRILLKNQTTASENGIYVVAASGAPTRAGDMAAASSAANASVYVEEGAVNADRNYQCTNNVGSDVVGTNNLTFTQFGTGIGALNLDDLGDVTITSAAQGDILYRNATGWVNLAAGTSGQVLKTNGAASNPAWVSAILADGSVLLTANWDAGSFQIRAETFQSDVATGTAPLTVASTTKVTNLNADQVDGKDSTALILVDGSQAFSGDQSLGGNKLTNVGTPTSSGDAATKGYVDAAINGLDWKASVRVATTANGTLATAFANGQTVDGVTLVTGDRILLKDQTTASENGIYIVAASGAPARASDMAAASSAANASLFVEAGTANADKNFVCTSNVGSDVVGTNNLTFTQFGTGGGVSALDDLSDVTITSAAAGQVLQHNGSAWVNAAPSKAAAYFLAGVS